MRTLRNSAWATPANNRSTSCWRAMPTKTAWPVVDWTRRRTVILPPRSWEVPALPGWVPRSIRSEVMAGLVVSNRSVEVVKKPWLSRWVL